MSESRVARDRATRAAILLAEIDRATLPDAADTQYGPAFWLGAANGALEALLRSLRETEAKGD